MSLPKSSFINEKEIPEEPDWTPLLRDFEALLDVLAVKGLISENEYMMSIENLDSFKPEENQEFEDYLMKRRTNLTKLMRKAGIFK